MTNFHDHQLNRLDHASLAHLSTRALTYLIDATDEGQSLEQVFALEAQGRLHGAGKGVERGLANFEQRPNMR